MKWLNRIDVVITWCYFYFMLGLLWVGAEYVFEGAVHSSHVDSVVNAVLTTLMVRETKHIAKG
jgi:hypothetical protein